MEPQPICQHFVQGVQGNVQVRKDKLEVDIYRFQHRDVVAALFKNLDQNLMAKNIDPPCQRLNDYVLSFSFKQKNVYQTKAELLLSLYAVREITVI